MEPQGHINYCPLNVTLSDFWVNHGISHCLIDTVFGTISTAFILLFGSVQTYFYKRYGTYAHPSLRPRSRLYAVQVCFSVLMPLLIIARILVVTLGDGTPLYGYEILDICSASVTWPLSLYLLLIERRKMLPTIPTKGHGVVVLIFWSLAFIKENLSFININSLEWWFYLDTVTQKIEFALFVLRYIGSCGLFVLGLMAPGVSSYPVADDMEQIIRPVQGRQKSLLSRLRILFPYLWPKNDCLLQLIVLFCLILLALGRVCNLFIPIYNKLIINSLSYPVDGKLEFRWDYVLVYCGLKFLQGGTGGIGLLNNLRGFLWIKVEQYTSREAKVQLFEHIHNLSLRWHLGRKTGEVLRVVDRGTTSITSLLSYIIFNILPTVADIVVAIVYFTSSFNAWFGLIVLLTMGLYLAVTIGVTEWRTKFRRLMNDADNKAQARAVDSILNFETVKYYNGEEYEVDRYRTAIRTYQWEEWKSNASLNLLNLSQNFVINAGLLAGCLLCAHMVVSAQNLTVGDFALFSAYILQLYAPLNFFGTYYRMIQQSFIDMENMFDLLSEQQEVQDAPDAKELVLKHGSIHFENIFFQYQPEKSILRGITFSVGPGETVALVGPSGSGKSTIIRLLYRFYDVQEGKIQFDGQDVRKVTQRSLRQAIGVVPQDTVLFNDTIGYNIRYGKPSATDEEVEAAAKGADIHGRILTFPDQYETVVGERGLKLSGGEKQRVAIARMILKAPTFIFLDEATSALDTQSERNIQGALDHLCANRTTIIVAHRLSTIIHADQILVLEDGQIVERGRHEELLSQGGLYASMWKQQQQKHIAESSDPMTYNCWLYQVCFSVLMPLLIIARILVVTFGDGTPLYGYEILDLCSASVTWPLSLYFLLIEHRKMLPMIPTKGHGVVLLIFWSLAFIKENLSFISIHSQQWWFHFDSVTQKLEFALFVLRYIGSCGLFVLGLMAPGVSSYHDAGDTEEIITPDVGIRRSLLNRLQLLFPYLWPKKHWLLQLVVLFSLSLLVLGHVCNLFMPIYNKLIINSLSYPVDGKLEFRWDYVLVYCGLKFLQGGTGGIGLLNNLRSFLWIKVQLFSHIHNLSLRWHMGRKIGEILRIVDRGTTSITSLLFDILFNILPTVADIVIAIVYFTSSFNAWFGLIVFITMGLYLVVTIGVTEWRTKFRRLMNEADNRAEARAVDSILNFETVKYYNGEEFEVDRYRKTILNYQWEEWKSNASLNLLNLSQNFFISAGLLSGSLFCAHLVITGQDLTIGDFALFSAYRSKLHAPMTKPYFIYHRVIQKSFIDMENMVDLLSEKLEIQDAPDARDLVVKQGTIHIKNVSFRYQPEKSILHGITFSVGPGETVALNSHRNLEKTQVEEDNACFICKLEQVGPSGSGKSTIIRLLYRFYDVQEGEIQFDGQDVREVTQRSLRRAIGVVPQDTVLFNDTIRYNIRYGKPSASDEEVEAAAKGADIHERILTFPDQYETMVIVACALYSFEVGERGLKLSGGEKQRVAIARMILKAPAFIFLDEATSALDTQSERNIQSALDNLCANRTTIIVAHRLSTIIHADQILVLENGQIMERGRHEELLNRRGLYASMWNQQQQKHNADFSDPMM
ncbi:unnamed protein product [Darwinula stevensoni]|uniref:ATP-binding cassette sub-family B member 6 n=1 Tax=Darwinula stevensoni TaxID=69355 RepID=A0A7R9FP68_9CRUS|nr:unnamed protein product [Darwinula stevensoni]CAG0897622.1 unnamed protein product [Darwinula stevensoni]